MRALADAVPWRHLVGFENRLKTRDRVEARISEDMRVKGRTVDEAFATLGDAIRYTFQYPEDRYKDGVAEDLERLWQSGFTEVRFRTTWPEHKGAVSCWRERSGVLFEVQFHTLPSYEAWQLTHPAYQRLCHPRTSDAERAELKAFIRKVYGFSGPGSSGAAAPAAGAGAAAAAEKVTYYAIVDSMSSPESPAGVLRRIEHAGGQRDEAFGRDLAWRHTFLLYSAERGNLDNDISEISEDEAVQIADQIRRTVAGQG
jgi:hypothetical protein